MLTLVMKIQWRGPRRALRCPTCLTGVDRQEAIEDYACGSSEALPHEGLTTLVWIVRLWIEPVLNLRLPISPIAHFCSHSVALAMRIGSPGEGRLEDYHHP